jgi:uncharacterized protein
MVQALTQSRPQERVPPPAPPRWKFAMVVWLAIYPSLSALLWLVGPTIVDWPLALRTFVLTAVLVPWMVFFMIPALQRLLAPWLRHSQNR